MEKNKQAALFCILRPALPLADKLSVVGQEMLQGTDALGVETSSPQTPGSPQAQPAGGSALSRAPSHSFYLRVEYDFSALVGRRGWEGEQAAVEEAMLPCCPFTCPLHGLLAEHMNDIGRVARMMQEDTNALLINLHCLSPSDLTALNLMHLPALGCHFPSHHPLSAEEQPAFVTRGDNVSWMPALTNK